MLTNFVLKCFSLFNVILTSQKTSFHRIFLRTNLLLKLIQLVFRKYIKKISILHPLSCFHSNEPLFTIIAANFMSAIHLIIAINIKLSRLRPTCCSCPFALKKNFLLPPTSIFCNFQGPLSHGLLKQCLSTCHILGPMNHTIRLDYPQVNVSRCCGVPYVQAYIPCRILETGVIYGTSPCTIKLLGSHLLSRWLYSICSVISQIPGLLSDRVPIINRADEAHWPKKSVFATNQFLVRRHNSLSEIL